MLITQYIYVFQFYYISVQFKFVIFRICTLYIIISLIISHKISINLNNRQWIRKNRDKITENTKFFARIRWKHYLSRNHLRYFLLLLGCGDLAIYANPSRCCGSKVSHDRESSRWLRVRYDPR